MSKNAQQLMQTLQERAITPRPAWQFRLLRTFKWAIFSLIVLGGGLSFAVILFAVQQTGFELLEHAQHSTLELTLAILPFTWLLFLALSLTLGMYNLRYTDRGYKFGLPQLAFYNCALSLVLGTFFFLFGGGKRLENAFAVHVSLYQSIEEQKTQLWSMPEAGYLGGTIEQATPDTIWLSGFDGQRWVVPCQGADVAERAQKSPGEKIKIIGQQAGQQLFQATAIRPWGQAGSRPSPKLRE